MDTILVNEAILGKMGMTLVQRGVKTTHLA